MKAIMIGMMLLFTLGSMLHAQKEDETRKVVYNLTSGDLEKLQTQLISGIIAHTTYYQSKLLELDVRVIIHGDAYKFFMKDLSHTAYAYQPKLVAKKENLQKRLSSLAKQYNVHFFVCEVGVKKRKLSPKAFYPFVSFVHNAAIGLIDAQNAGYAYLAIP